MKNLITLLLIFISLLSFSQATLTVNGRNATITIPSDGSGANLSFNDDEIAIARKDIDTLFIDGTYKYLTLKLYGGGGGGTILGVGDTLFSKDSPLVISNTGGIAEVTDDMELQGWKNFKMTGTGSNDTYGFLIGGRLYIGEDRDTPVSGTDVYAYSTDVEVEFVEIRHILETTFAGLQMRNQTSNGDSLNFFNNARVHNNLVWGIGEGEGNYLGTPFAADAPSLKLFYYNNTSIEAGRENGQFDLLAEGSKVFNNVFWVGANFWLGVGQGSQSGLGQHSVRNGDVIIENNIYGGGNNYVDNVSSESEYTPFAFNGEPFQMRNNLFAYSRRYGMFINRSDDYALRKVYRGNYFGNSEESYQVRKDSVRTDGDSLDYKPFWIDPLITNDIQMFLDNKADTSKLDFINPDPDDDPLDYVEIGNTETNLISRPIFVNSGFNDSTENWNEHEKWLASIDVGAIYDNQGETTVYPTGYVVYHKDGNGITKAYRVTQDVTGAIEPNVTSGWESYYTEIPLGLDYRLEADNFYNLLGMGLLDNEPNDVTSYQWQWSPDQSTWENIPAATLIKINTGAWNIWEGWYIRLKITDQEGDVNYSNTLQEPFTNPVCRGTGNTTGITSGEVQVSTTHKNATAYYSLMATNTPLSKTDIAAGTGSLNYGTKAIANYYDTIDFVGLTANTWYFVNTYTVANSLESQAYLDSFQTASNVDTVFLSFTVDEDVSDDPFTRTWNNIYAVGSLPISIGTYSNLVDKGGISSGWGLTLEGSSNTTAANGIGLEGNTQVGNSATDTGWKVAALNSTGELRIRISGLDNGTTYDIGILGSDNAAGDMDIDVNGTLVDNYDYNQNPPQFTIVNNISPTTGYIELDIQLGTINNDGYLNTLWIVEN